MGLLHSLDNASVLLKEYLESYDNDEASDQESMLRHLLVKRSGVRISPGPLKVWGIVIS